MIGSLSMRLIPKEDESILSNGIPTGATDGKYLYCHPDIMKPHSMIKGSFDLLRSLVGHETLHNAMNHVGRRGARDHELWGQAADYAINGILHEMGFAIGENWCYDPAYKGMSAEEIYEMLAQQKQQEQGWKRGPSRPSKKDGAGETGGHVVIDIHMPPGGKGAGKEEQRKIADNWKQWVNEAAVAEAIRRQQEGQNLNKGYLPAGLEELIREIRTPKTDVVEIVSTFVTKALTDRLNWSRPNRRLLPGTYWPTRWNDIIDIVFIMDTSGSVSNKQAGYALGIFQDILTNLPVGRVRYMEVDAAVAKDIYVGKEGFPEPEISITGRGGTSFIPPFTVLQEDEDGFVPNIGIYVTDGCGSFPPDPPDFPVLWVYNHKSARIPQPPWGEFVAFDDNDVAAEERWTGSIAPGM